MACGQPRHVEWRSPTGPVCARCRHRHLAAKITCQACHQTRRPATVGAGEVLCADCAGMPSAGRCSACGTEDHNFDAGLCQRCSLKRRVEALRATGDPAAIRGLEPYLDALAASPQPRSVLSWLHRSRGARTLEALARGELELSHAALDTIDTPGTTAIKFLRAALVEHGALPARAEPLARLETWTAAELTKLSAGADRTHVRAYATWKVTRGYARALAREARRPPTQESARELIAQAVALTAALHAQQLTLADLRQDWLDTWLLDGPEQRRRVNGFIKWLRKRRVIGAIEVPPWPAHQAVAPAADTDRLQLVGRLLEDDSLDVRDRVAGLLVLLYAQMLTRIARLRRDDILQADGHVLLRLGGEPIRLPEPLARLTLQLASQPAPASTAATGASAWLFPGRRLNEPISPQHLSRRLSRLGIPARPGRLGALIHLLHNIPAPVLGELIGMAPSVAERWSAALGADYANYVALKTNSRSSIPATATAP